MKYYALVLAILCSAVSLQAKNYLFCNGKSEYIIVLPTNASVSEKTAATELQSYLKQISGVTLPIKNKVPSKGNYVFVGYNSAADKIKPKPTSEAFTYKTKNGNLYIWGGANRGTMYGVFSFLENELGIRWYTSDYTKVPRKSEYVLPSLSHTETPCIKQRLDFYNTPLTDAIWCAHNKMNEQYSMIKNKYGNTSAFYGIHTMFNFVKPEQYFKTHPEYYSQVKGKRQHEVGQLCLSNKEVLAIVKQSVLQTIKENPDYWVYDVSQMDNQNYCQCDQCSALAERYGGQSGLMIWFVNQVADAVKQKFPTKKISTFAYLYTRHAPTGIKPSNNVIVRLCDIECCFSHPLSSKACKYNNAFMSDLADWGKLTSNIYIWDYVVNFHNYLVPYPNFPVLSENIRSFSKNGAIGVMEEGVHECKWGEFSELRTWVLAKLLWNPNKTSINALVREFCMDYYGKGGDDVYAYYLMTQRVPADVHVVYNTHYERDLYDEDFVVGAMAVLEDALLKVKGDAEMEKRINRVLAQVYYMSVCQNLNEAKKNGIYQKLKRILQKDPTNIKEGINDLDQHIKTQGHT